MNKKCILISAIVALISVVLSAILCKYVETSEGYDVPGFYYPPILQTNLNAPGSCVCANGRVVVSNCKNNNVPFCTIGSGCVCSTGN